MPDFNAYSIMKQNQKCQALFQLSQYPARIAIPKHSLRFRRLKIEKTNIPYDLGD